MASSCPFSEFGTHMMSLIEHVADAHVRQVLRSADTRTLVVTRTRTILATGPLPAQNHKSGTAQSQTVYVGCHTASSGGYRRHFYSDSEATAQCELFLTAPNRNILTYLLLITADYP